MQGLRRQDHAQGVHTWGGQHCTAPSAVAMREQGLARPGLHPWCDLPLGPAHPSAQVALRPRPAAGPVLCGVRRTAGRPLQYIAHSAHLQRNQARCAARAICTCAAAVAAPLRLCGLRFRACVAVAWIASGISLTNSCFVAPCRAASTWSAAPRCAAACRACRGQGWAGHGARGSRARTCARRERMRESWRCRVSGPQAEEA